MGTLIMTSTRPQIRSSITPQSERQLKGHRLLQCTICTYKSNKLLHVNVSNNKINIFLLLFTLFKGLDQHV